MRHGKLVGSIQQPHIEGGEAHRGAWTDESERREAGSEWWAIGNLCEKEGEEEGSKWEEFASKKEANTAWKNLLRDVQGKAGRAALLVNCMTRKVVSKSGGVEELDRLDESGPLPDW